MPPFVHRLSRAPCYSTPAYGGFGGAAFADPCSNVAGIVQITLSAYSDVVKSLRVKYQPFGNGEPFWAPQHGDLVTTQHQLYFGEGEHIIAIVGRADSLRLRQIAFLTRTPTGQRHVFGPYGSTTLGEMFTINANVVSFFGKSGADIDSLGFFYRP